MFINKRALNVSAVLLSIFALSSIMVDARDFTTKSLASRTSYVIIDADNKETIINTSIGDGKNDVETIIDDIKEIDSDPNLKVENPREVDVIISYLSDKKEKYNKVNMNVKIGNFSSIEEAKDECNKIRNKYFADSTSQKCDIDSYKANGHDYYTLYITGFGDKSSADAFCNTAQKDGIDCAVTHQ